MVMYLVSEYARKANIKVPYLFAIHVFRGETLSQPKADNQNCNLYPGAKFSLEC